MDCYYIACVHVDEKDRSLLRNVEPKFGIWTNREQAEAKVAELNKLGEISWNIVRHNDQARLLEDQKRWDLLNQHGLAVGARPEASRMPEHAWHPGIDGRAYYEVGEAELFSEAPCEKPAAEPVISAIPAAVDVDATPKQSGGGLLDAVYLIWAANLRDLECRGLYVGAHTMKSLPIGEVDIADMRFRGVPITVIPDNIGVMLEVARRQSTNTEQEPRIEESIESNEPNADANVDDTKSDPPDSVQAG